MSALALSLSSHGAQRDALTHLCFATAVWYRLLRTLWQRLLLAAWPCSLVSASACQIYISNSDAVPGYVVQYINFIPLDSSPATLQLVKPASLLY